MMNSELTGLYGSDLLKEISEIIGYYNAFEKGAEFTPEGSKDYKPAKLPYKYIKSLISKEAAFMFSKPLDFNIKTDNKDDDEQAKRDISILQSFINAVLKKNKFNNKILKAAKDCFIGKRIALVLNFNEQGIGLSFSPSLEFIYETDDNDTDKITKIVLFYTRRNSDNKKEQEIYKKRYWMGEDGFCHVHEALYNGMGEEKEVIIEDLRTKFDYIPGVIIINEGLTGDLDGESDVENLLNYEEWYSRLSSADIDTMRKGMNPIRYTRDMDSNSTKHLSISAGAYWDLMTDQNLEEANPEQGIIETDLSYSDPFSKTLERIRKAMYNQLNVPDLNTDKLSGIVASGKTFKAIYWELIIRCEEKLTAWRPALEFIGQTIIEGAKLYPESASPYLNGETIPDVDYIVDVVNSYPIPEDEQEEKETDLAEVNAQTMSKKSYIKKWKGLTDKEADAEIEQIAKERELLEDNYDIPVEPYNPPVGNEQ
jgi:hypothetical protein